jgi:hypothetical protein
MTYLKFKRLDSQSSTSKATPANETTWPVKFLVIITEGTNYKEISHLSHFKTNTL